MLDCKDLSPLQQVGSNTPQSVLVIGGTGLTGVECIVALDKHHADYRPKIHAFCRNPDKMPLNAKAACDSVIVGDARSALDVERAMTKCMADVVIVSVGHGESLEKTDLRTASAHALVQAMKKQEFSHVHAIVISSSGAGTSKIMVGLGIGSLIAYQLRNVLQDHTDQEAAFLNISAVARRTTIVRPTSLTNKYATGKMLEMDDSEPMPSKTTDRADLALWIVKEIYSPENLLKQHRIVNVTGDYYYPFQVPRKFIEYFSKE